MLKKLGRKAKGFTLIELLIVVAIIGILAAIAIPNLMSAQRRAKYSRAAADTKTATTQAIVYQNDKQVYPGTIANLRDMGYANVPDYDPWGTAAANKYVVSDLFADTGNTANTANIELHVCSVGANNDTTGCTGTSLATQPESKDNGSVGYSATYGGWMGK